jgi:hypothetical protein
VLVDHDPDLRGQVFWVQPVVDQRVGGAPGKVGHVGGDVEQLRRRKLDRQRPGDGGSHIVDTVEHP